MFKKYSALKILLVIFIVSCSSGIDNEPEALLWYGKNKAVLFNIKEILEANSHIKRVNASTNKSDSATEKIKNLILASKIENVFVSDDPSKKTDFFVISYTLGSSGMIGEGSSISIDYVRNIKYIDRLDDDESQYKPLADKHWYLVVYKSKKGVSYKNL